ncbi:transposase [Janibacter terrae]|uniref:transposase n=1 Tax=Janibacter terrae TaxID=103817 RepID=UPI003D15825F
MPKPYPGEFRDNVLRVARNREPGVHLKRIAADFGISESQLTNWMKTADVEDGVKPGTTANEKAELREAKKRMWRLKQENAVLRRAALPGDAAGHRPCGRPRSTSCWTRPPG